ncbi:hypothetical protein JHL21_15990 [Devosia sp. WQ 349]|uniref:hypothetical protein n=1 Tax=Devosia sp. WQ 349K1 TaxID=2800329 RepID=UPI00190556DF|nr:hypothetical protein [Devosia sp. WQ 349K1]MBK1795993.1 hypothetical protein [Devosia sp. WQ 349K1]
MTVTDDTIAQCNAVTFAAGQATSELMREFGKKIGFQETIDYPRFAENEAKGLNFFLVHGSIPDANKLRLIRALRSHPDVMRRFAPVVCLLSGGPRHQVVPLVEMGFDEVLFLVDSVDSMRAKLNAQLNHRLMYVQTSKYFGPDRRRIELVDRNDPRRKYGGSEFRRIMVVRNPTSGIETQEAL